MLEVNITVDISEETSEGTLKWLGSTPGGNIWLISGENPAGISRGMQGWTREETVQGILE